MGHLPGPPCQPLGHGVYFSPVFKQLELQVAQIRIALPRPSFGSQEVALSLGAEYMHSSLSLIAQDSGAVNAVKAKRNSG